MVRNAVPLLLDSGISIDWRDATYGVEIDVIGNRAEARHTLLGAYPLELLVKAWASKMGSGDAKSEDTLSAAIDFSMTVTWWLATGI